VLAFRPAEDPRFRATFPAEIYCIRPEGEVVDLVGRAGFDVVDTRRRSAASACPFSINGRLGIDGLSNARYGP